MATTFPPDIPRSPLLARSEPGKLPAALLALIVHAGFFTVIVFGVTWQVKHPDPVMAELWDQLPSIRNAPEPPAPEPEPVVKKVVEPPPVEKPLPGKADIELKAKKEKAEREKDERERLEKQKQAELEKKRKEEDAQKKAAKAADDKAKVEQAAREAAANNAALRDYAARISTLISSRANIPDTVSGKPELTIRLRLLVNGVVFDAQIIKPSGNRVYDEAVERAINGIRQWPLPENPALFGGRRELNLNIAHER